MSETNINELSDKLRQVSVNNGEISCAETSEPEYEAHQDDIEKNEEKKALKTGLIYDERMANYVCVEGPHPERPDRVKHIYQKLLDSNLVNRCVNLTPRLATRQEIICKHSEKHFDFIASLVDKEEVELGMLADKLDSIYLHPNVSESALLAAGCTIEMVEQVLNGKILNGAAVVRPPGHHAEADKSMGFCHFNSVALAAMMAIKKYKLTRILILDWDIHYGNATHQMFEDDPKVLYFSLHRYDNNEFWPNIPEANHNAVGKGDGEGFNVHVAWNKSKIKDSSYLYAFNHLLIPILKQYDPELILVSAGFDAGINDPIGGCKVTPVGYAHMTKKLMQFAGGKIVIVLEGGYNLKTISDSMAACVSTLLGDDVPAFIPVDSEKPSNSALQSITDTFFTHLMYWQKALGSYKTHFLDLRANCEVESDNDSSSSDEEA